MGCASSRCTIQPFTLQRCTIHALFIHKLYLSLDVINRLAWGILPTLHGKVKRINSIIQVGFDSFP